MTTHSPWCNHIDSNHPGICPTISNFYCYCGCSFSDHMGKPKGCTKHGFHEPRMDNPNPVNADTVKSKQVGGDHYKGRRLQPWDLWEEFELDPWEANAVKYLLRWKDKNGVEDLRKAIHYIEYLIEREENGKA